MKRAIKLLDDVYISVIEEHKGSKEISYILQLIDDLQNKMEELNN